MNQHGPDAEREHCDKRQGLNFVENPTGRAYYGDSLGHGCNPCLGLEPGRKCGLPLGSLLRYTVIMKKAISVKRKKPGRPATGTDPLYGVRIPEELMDQIEEWAAKNSATRSDAIRRLVEIGLKAKK
jgi:hypothetical protein